MKDFRAPARVYYWGVVAAATIVLTLAGLSLAGVSQQSAIVRQLVLVNTAPFMVLLLFLVADVLADVFHIHVHSRIEIVLSTAVNLGALLIFGPATALWLAVAGSVVSDLLFKKAWYKLLFNAANVVCSIFLGCVLYGLLINGGSRDLLGALNNATAYSMVYRMANGSGPDPIGSMENAMAIAVSGAVYLIVSLLILATMIGLLEGKNPLDITKSTFRGMLFQLITLIPLGMLFAIIYAKNPWGLVLLVFPIMLSYLSFRSYEKLRRESRQTIELLAEAVDKRDTFTFQHSLRVAEITEKLAQKMGVDIEDTEKLVFAARIHDLGKVGIPSSILLKKGRLTAEERRVIEEHPGIGANILREFRTYNDVRDIIAQHHERIDGRGYPDRLRDKQIALGARILAVADSFEAMTSDRPYRKALSLDEAVSELQKGRGSQFDTTVVETFLGILAGERSIRQQAFRYAIEREG